MFHYICVVATLSVSFGKDVGNREHMEDYINIQLAPNETVNCTSCSYCRKPWGGLQCFVCKKHTISKNDCEPYAALAGHCNYVLHIYLLAAEIDSVRLYISILLV